MLEEENVQLKVRISREVNRRLKQYVSSKHPDLLRGPLSEEVEKAIVQYLDSKQQEEKGLAHARTHTQKQQQQQQTSSSIKKTINKKYQRLIELIRQYSNSKTKQISSGLARKAIMEVIGKDERTIDKYLKLLQDDDILYGNSLGGSYEVQSWVFGDSIKLVEEEKEELQQQTTVSATTNSWSRLL